MSAKRKVLSYKQLPARLPVNFTIGLWLLLKVSYAPEWVWGATTVVMLIVWAAAIISIWTQEAVTVAELFKEDQ